ncbi:uncharacterized protein (DUF1800 family) [Tahibacter aquaticus]|uniref:Uncharacterized protein (DUF1800 family) n=1 Tax=Tahibacter aquaticus TaxID=520092 RepID=A0A4R6Z9A7_9GAMM|nr:DUF1800 domain-containing protein [Tahibacter aquaticus]TDR48481.1 uncharacterized protein (DUF1800 family) [Tahibacter aquaticus]
MAVSTAVRAVLRVLCCGVLAAAGTAVLAQSTSHSPDQMLRSGFEGPAAGPFTDAEAARFLNQATYGATLSEIAHLRAVGYEAWFTEQFNETPSYQQPYLDWVSALPGGVYQQQRLEAWLINSIGLYDPSNPPRVHKDQLRQRMALALSEIFVVSDQNAGLLLQAWSTASWYDMLARNAFGSYRVLLQDVTLHPAMGVYLSMVGNRKPDAALNIRPDENFAREILQLFSIGLKQLNLDGSPVLNAGQPVPTYNQNTVRGFAHVFTGWNFNDCSAAEYPDCVGEYHNPDSAAVREAMLPFEAYHDNTGNKQLLVYANVALPGGVLTAGGNAQAELAAALDNIAAHPNVAPFISRQLIQRLVTSNPSPGYIARVAAVFNDNGAGVRGDLRAVVKAILLDGEARFGHWGANADRYGKLREPMLKLTQLWRITAPRSANGRINLHIDPALWYGQAPLRSPSVFNFFRPTFQQPGEIRDLGLLSPEFQIATDTMLVATPNDLDWRIFYFYIGSTYSYAQETDAMLMDYGATLNPLAAQPGQLIDRLNLLLMSGQMSPFMREVILTRLNALPNDNGGRDRVQHALYLVLNSPEYAIQK